MVFSSPLFLFFFLPLFLAGYYIVPERRRSLWIVIGSWLFYGWWRFDFLLLLAGSSLGAVLVGARIGAAAAAGEQGRARRWMIGGVATALGLLGYFKYFNFGMDSLSAAIVALGGRPPVFPLVILPIGISFYTFQIISYIVDVYRGVTPPGRKALDVVAYVSLFPQLVAGPIVRYSEISNQFLHREHSWEKFSRGAERFMLGLARKVLIADAVAPLVDVVFATSAPGFSAAWIGLLAYTVQIYFDFAAYSDMAIGLGRMMGFAFPENFRMPYHSRSITEFWRRWHMTLSAWLRDYLYLPLGGNRRGYRRTLVNLMIVMLLGGLWHGAAWTFVLWGAWHGGWLVLERVRGPSRAENSPLALLARVRTVFIVMAGWVLFRSDSFGGAATLLWNLSGAALVSGAGTLGIPDTIRWQMSTGSLAALLLGIGLVIFEPWIARRLEEGRALPLRPVVLPALFLFSVLRLLAASYSPFLYFQF
ncbi:MAG: MBOAT family protein [Spirochaetaceae bacterium]|nr:MAG: MBOAT family protein [Spirochaetaceae bacterium]